MTVEINVSMAGNRNGHRNCYTGIGGHVNKKSIVASLTHDH